MEIVQVESRKLGIGALDVSPVSVEGPVSGVTIIDLDLFVRVFVDYVMRGT